MFHLLHHPSANTHREHRLLHRGKAEAQAALAEAAAGHAEKGADKAGAAAGAAKENIAANQAAVLDAIKKAAPGALEAAKEQQAAAAPTKPTRPPIMAGWKPLPRPPTGAIKGAAGAGAFLILPVLTTAAAAAWQGWKKLSKHRPFRWVNDAVGWGYKKTTNAVSNIATAASYPFRLGGALTMNTLWVGKEVVARSLDATVGELYRDTMKVINAKSGLPEGTNALTATIHGGKSLLMSPIRLLMSLGEYVKQHPVKGPAMIVGGLIAATHWQGTVNLAFGVKDIVVSILKALIVKMGGTVPVGI